MKRLSITDLHFGAKNNSETHNQDLLDFINYLIDWVVSNLPDEPVGLDILGDTFHTRDRLDVSTIYYARKGMSRLVDSGVFEDIRILKGNHDLYYRDTRIVSSVDIFRDMVNVVDDHEIVGDCLYTSWVCTGGEYDDLVELTKKHDIKYVFGHFEFSTFLMNENYRMTHGSTHKALSHVDKVFSGHYHMRQQKDNVTYVGTPFPYDMNDANDIDRGFMVFDTVSGEHHFVNYEKITIISMDYKEALQYDFENMDDMTIRVVIDDDISEDVLEDIKTKLDNGGFRETRISYNMHKASNEALQEETKIGELKGVDESVIAHIQQMTDVEDINKQLLQELYEESIHA